MKIYGIIHMIALNDKIIGIKSYKTIKFFHFKASLMNTFRRYLYQDNWIELEYDENKMVKSGNYLAYETSYVIKVEARGRFDSVIYYDKYQISKSLYQFLDSLDIMMFVDFEMSMPPYNFKGKGFKTELIQAGFITVDKNYNVLDEYNNYIKPKISTTLSKRTLDFLNISNEEFENNVIPYNDFYNDFKHYLLKYSPAIIIYGRNDKLVLESSYEINYVKSLESKTRFINLCQLVKTFYELKNDPGLFKLLEAYYDKDYIQVHNALSDSKATLLVYQAFKKDVLERKYIEKIRSIFN